MNELPPPPPSATPVVDTGAPDVARRFRHPVALFVWAATLAALAGGAVGTASGTVIYHSANADCGPRDSWCELGGLVYGFLGGAAIGMAVYVVAGIVVIRRYRPSGRRAGHIAAHVATPLAAPVALATLLSLIPA